MGASAYFLNRASLARWAVDGRELSGALQGSKPKVVFVVLADGTTRTKPPIRRAATARTRSASYGSSRGSGTSTA